jgi:hypothetical protein
MRIDPEAQVAQNLGSEPVTQADILESNHVILRWPAAAATTKIGVTLIRVISAVAMPDSGRLHVKPAECATGYVFARRPSDFPVRGYRHSAPSPTWFPIR